MANDKNDVALHSEWAIHREIGISFDRKRPKLQRGQGWGIVIRNSSGDVVMAGVQQGLGFAGPEVEEARVCIFGLRQAIAAGFVHLVIEGDCLSLIQKLRSKQRSFDLSLFLSFMPDLLLSGEGIRLLMILYIGNYYVRQVGFGMEMLQITLALEHRKPYEDTSANGRNRSDS
ncbi:hypothetical protein Cgig2_023106 [Carnegiea gigantea]|uniref:RNase H type-1 domain-containing protein n=1 Tax=Carnegiea gigantea TaxID=171969 RepID=A0A9Q1GMY3_9CARY|nr:hypothetical protein Cgig2_023106 [Carnegiea gigantea]